MDQKIAIIRIRGGIGVKTSIKDTLELLRLYRKNHCVLRKSTPSLFGMLKKTESYITWGEIDQETKKLLLEKREEKKQNKKGEEIKKPFFRLQPPRKGFGRKGVKIQFKLGGALGYRGEKINDLIKRMV